jgi:hypothetical protein
MLFGKVINRGEKAEGTVPAAYNRSLRKFGKLYWPHLHFQLQDGLSFYYSAGLPIRFSNIKLDSNPNYSLMDSRPHMDAAKIPEGRISRGYYVSNN